MVTNVDRQLHRYLKKISASSKICKGNQSKHYWITNDSGSVVLHVRLSDHVSGQMFDGKKSEKIDIIKVEKSNVYIVMGFGIQVNLWEDEVVKFVKHLIGSRVMVSKQFSKLVYAAGKHAHEVKDLKLQLVEIQKNLKISRGDNKDLTKKNNILKENLAGLNNKHLKTVKKIEDLKSENEELNQRVIDLERELESAKALLSNIYSSVNPIMEEIKTNNN